MSVERLCDTMVFYDIDGGVISPADIRIGDAQIAVQPHTILEIVHRISEENFTLRKAAFIALLDSADVYLPDPGSILLEAWGLTDSITPVDWRNWPEIVASANSYSELYKREGRKISNVHKYIRYQYQGFLKSMYAAIETRIPGYSTARASGRHLTPKKSDVESFEKWIRSDEASEAFLIATYLSACSAGNVAPRQPSSTQMLEAFQKLRFYISVYSAYCARVVAGWAPDANDCGDLEMFYYLSECREIVTRETRWHQILADAGLSHFLFTPRGYG